MIKNSPGSRLFSDVYGQASSQPENLTKKGELSCAYFVSSILKIFDLIGAVHLTVSGTITDLQKTGWKRITKNIISAGDIIVWSEKNQHRHIGFYIGGGQAVSNNSKSRKIAKHHYTFQDKRKIEEIFSLKIN